MTKNYKRRKYFINKEVQGKFIIKFVIASILVTLSAITLLNYLAYRKLDTVLFSMKLPQHHGAILENEMLYVNGLAIIFIIFAFIITAKKIVNRINGPVIKLCSDIDRIALGNLKNRIRLREKDEFRDFGEGVDEMRKKLHEKFKSISLLSGELQKLSGEAKDPKGFQMIKKQLDGKFVELDRLIRQFNL